MQQVNERFYILYIKIATIVAALLMVLCIAGQAIPGMRGVATRWDLSYTTFGIALVQVLYGVFLYKRQAVKIGYWAATLLGVMLLSVNIVNLVHTTGMFHSWYLIAWGITLLLSGLFGSFTIIGGSFLVTIYFILVSTDALGKASYSPHNIIALSSLYLIGVISYFASKPFYVDRESNQIAQLTGQLRNNQQRAEVLIQSVSDGIIMTDTKGKISLLNPAAAVLTGWSVQEAMDLDVQLVAKFTYEDGKDLPSSEYPFTKALADKTAKESTLRLTSRDGKSNPIVSLAISPILTGKGDEIVGFVAVLRDVSSAREEEHRRADFISTASHEMRTPVAAIEGYLALALNDKVARIDNKARDYLTKAHESTQHLGTLFQDLLTSAKAEDGRLVNHPLAVDMGEFTQKVADGLQFSAEKKGLLLDFVIGGMNGASGENSAGTKVIRPLYFAYVDPDRMREVITNLFDNAIKYTPAGKITVGLTGNEGVVQIFVRDTGGGIPAEDISHLFQKFYRVDNTATRTIGGTGLGLFICRKIVELYNGRIWVESEVGKGSTFYINLPRISAQEATKLKADEAQAAHAGLT
ncbi:MAG: ATP-binding protein [Candidatus Saccharimonadales bacterium]